MKRTIISALSAVLSVSALLMTGCVREELPDNRDTDYGYLQFKLYKESSYESVLTKAITRADGNTDAEKSQLDSLFEAGKISVSLVDGSNQSISQTLTLSSSDAHSAEFGLRSSKFRLLKGDYQLRSYILYDNMDNVIYRQVVNETVSISPGGLEVYDLTADVRPRGMIRFSLVKDMSGFRQDPDNPQLEDDALNSPIQRVSQRPDEYSLDEVAFMDIVLQDAQNAAASGRRSFTMIPVSFSVHFDGDETYTGEEGVTGTQTSSSVADSVVYAPAGQYKIYSYSLYDEDENLLEFQDYSLSYQDQESVIVVEDNKLTEGENAEIPVTLVEADAYIQDNYALYLLWKALDGPNWSYEGQTYNNGANWNFDKDIDLWCDQPGVQIHPNGRIASIDLSGFGIKGEVPAAIGQFDELVELSFGNHNETNQYVDAYEDDLPYPVDGTDEEKAQWRERRSKQFAAMVRRPEQMSPVCALALKLHGETSPAATMYDAMTTKQISRMAAGTLYPSDYQLKPYDMNHGKLTNGLTKIHENIGRLTRLESLTIANSPIEAEGIPSDALANLSSVTELVIYNCPNLKTLPAGFARMGGIIQANISNNGFTSEGANAALKALAEGAAEDVLQILYFRENHLTEFPEEIGRMGRLGMLDLSMNDISGTLPDLSANTGFTPEELYFDDNSITGFEGDAFCSLADLDAFSISYNKLTRFPNIFTSDKNAYVMSSINVAHNEITTMAPETGAFNGFRSKALTLSGNPIKTYPKEIAESNSYVEQIVMQQCGLTEFPEGCLKSDYSMSITTLDLQYNNLSDLPDDFTRENVPSLYGLDLTSNAFSKFPFEPLYIMNLTAFSIRGQRDANGDRCLSQWPTNIGTNTGLRGFYIGSNNLGVIDDSISFLIFYLDISDNPNITFDASDICSYWQAGAYTLYYDQSQEIIGCDAMLD